MTELQIMKNAKACLELLAQGIDPLTREPVSDSDTVRKPAIAKYLNFVAERLQKDILSEQRKEEDSFARFYVSPERASKFKAEADSVTITKIIKVINSGFSQEENGFIPSIAVSLWLESKGLLIREPKEDGSYRRIASEKASDYGITNTYAKNGNFKSVIYSTQAQQWMYDSIEEIIEFCIQHSDMFPRAERTPITPES